MLSEYLLIPNRHMPFEMLITYLLKQQKFDLSCKRSIAPSIDINNTLLNRMHVGERAPAPIPPLLLFHLLYLDPQQFLQIPMLHSQLNFKNSLKISSQLKKMLTRQEEI